MEDVGLQEQESVLRCNLSRVKSMLSHVSAMMCDDTRSSQALLHTSSPLVVHDGCSQITPACDI